MTRQSFADGVQWAWDATSLDAYIKCPRYYQYVILEGWSPTETSVHLEFGGAYATAIEHFHKHIAAGMTETEALREIVREALVATWRDGAPVEWLHQSKTREGLIRSIIWYVLEFGDDDTMKPVILASGAPAVELSFSIELGEYLWCGHLDRLCEYSGDPYVMDQKTTGTTLTPYFFKQFKPSNQMAGYTLAGKIAYNTPVVGVVIDGAQIAVNFTRFSRGYVTFNDEELEEWMQETTATIEEARLAVMDHLETGRDMRRRTTSCGNYGGCAFREVCARPPSIRKQFLLGDFTIRKNLWDPLERR